MKVNIEVQNICVPKQNLRGIPYYTINLVESLVKRNMNDYSLSFFDYKKERDNKKYVQSYLNNEVLDDVKLLECNFFSYKSLIEYHEKQDANLQGGYCYEDYFNYKADIYHFPSPHCVPMNVKGKIVVTIHDVIPFRLSTTKDSNKEKLRNVMKYIEDNDEIVVATVSEYSKYDICNFIDIDERRVFVTHNGYDRSVHFPEKNQNVLQNLGINGAYVLFLGSIDRYKGIINILDAFEMIKPHYKDLQLVIAGNIHRSLVDIINRINNYKLREDVVLTGFVDDLEKRVLLSSAEVFLFPSEYEGFGLPVIEAMACGSPVVTSNVSSLPEVGGDAAVYVSPNKPEELAEKVRELLDSKEKRENCIKRGFAQAKKFSWDKTAAMTEEVYCRMM